MKRLTDGTGEGPEDERTSEDPEVHSITSAAPGHSEDMHKRMVRYAIAMGIRMVCIIMLFVLDGWFKLIAVAGAVFLPWVAVVIANAQDTAETPSDALIDAPPVAELEGGLAAAREDDVVLQGELFDGEDDGGTPASGGPAGRAGDGGDRGDEAGEEKRSA
ncbi:DUF3099 domain-containing protein [Sinomonas sp. ASV322]|uniref:DUF3099 domain-containing protein n=1 Tax=Sinomonas sp. ASV322 TaxID=3041920 RepID=UPI0027DC57BD|nr:DUF3099 domain-containing protein [Sinomonas sp. ASV322]MDQ4500989.1 DUF3099 domain-containing protein [Sinomonas sp. ASV322]